MPALEIILPLAVKYGPDLVAAVVAAFQKQGITIAQLEAMFADVKPYEQLGINPAAPVKPA